MNTVSNNYYKKQRRGAIFAGVTVGILALVLTACQSATPAPVAAPADTPVAVAAPTNTPVPAAAPTDTSVPANTPALVSPKAIATPSVTVADQPIKDDTVTIAKVVSNGPAWIVIHADKNGAPGPVLGEAAAADGENTNVVVKLAAEGRTETLYAMLHTDAGTVGTYEFPGPDGPVSVDGKVVTPAFKITGGLGASAAPSQEVTVKIANFKFAPAELTVKVGTTVVWTSEDAAPHTVTADDNSFDSGNMKKGDTFKFTFTKAGKYSYYCAYHGSAGGGGMAGAIVVTN